MSKVEADSYDAERQARDAALSRLTGRYVRLRAGLEEKSVVERLVEHASGKAKAAANEAVEIAEENKGVIAGTTALLVLWMLRRPIAGQARKWLPQLPVTWQRIVGKHDRDNTDQETDA